jgi:HEAT repeat protein
MPTTRAQVGTLVRQLGDDRVDVQEAATEALIRLGTDAVEMTLMRIVAQTETSTDLRRRAARALYLFNLAADLRRARGTARDHVIAELVGLGSAAWVVIEPALVSGDPVERANGQLAADELAKRLSLERLTGMAAASRP